jgi:hypothetical protein
MTSPASTSARCQSPISWLRLEQHHLGELTTDREAVADHLRSCAECAALLARIAEDAGELPALPPARAKESAPVRPLHSIHARPWYSARGLPIAIASGLALAAVVVLAIGRRPQPADEDPAGARMKGSDLSFTLVREDEAVIAEAGGSYRDGERFKALLTCPPGIHASFDLAVFEQGAAAFPLPPSTDLACGNAIALPGAFRVTGHERMTVCLVWQPDGAIDREAIRRTPPDLLPHALCKTLDPSPSVSP